MDRCTSTWVVPHTLSRAYAFTHD